MKTEEKEAENIRVAVRCRPMNEREINEQAMSCFQCDENGNAVLTNLENPTEKYEFGYDFVYGCDTGQTRVFEDIGVPLLDRAFGGYNGTIFAYGQTGSGKTFSMTGLRGDEELEGLIPRMNKLLFSKMEQEKQQNPQKHFLVECSFFEIYNEVIYDLLDSNGAVHKKTKGAGLEIKEHSVLGIYVKDLQERVVETREEVSELMAMGAMARTVGATQMNAESSRSHSIFVIKLHQKDASDETKSIFAKINLVDLAGSERAASTGAQGERLKEGANINKSLSALGNVINALVEVSRTGKKAFIPYRNSKLTRVLQESLGGNSLCSMLATLSPANINFHETLSTLKYASRAKSIKVNATKNESSSQISKLNEEIATLKKKLMEQTETTLGLDPKEKEEIVKKYEKQIQEMDKIRMQTWEDKSRLSKQHEMERKRLAKEKELADKKIQEERTRKWRLLEEKNDIELVIRAIRDLDVAQDYWLEYSKRIKSRENNAKERRTLIMVFRDSLDKDIETWAKHEGFEDASMHMTANQICIKLQNIRKESAALMQIETSLLEEANELINVVLQEVCDFKRKVALERASSGAKIASREDDPLQEERDKGLSITLAMMQNYRATLVSSVQAERQRVFELTHTASEMVNDLRSHAADPKVPPEKKQSWLENVDKVEKELAQLQSSHTSQQKIVASYLPRGEVIAMGLESKALADTCISSSSSTNESRLVRMNSPGFWIPDEADAAPYIQLDFELPRFFHAIEVRGAVLRGSGNNWKADSSSTGASGTKSQESGDEGRFVLPTLNVLQGQAQRFKLEEVSGDYQQTFDLLSTVISWMELLKSNQIPTKLFQRPPVRFLHDVVSMVIRNTQFARHLFSPSEMDYAQLPSKNERGDYLSKLITFVQESLQTVGSDVIVAAQSVNILAGKEPTDTLRLMALFALLALRHVISSYTKVAEQYKSQTQKASKASSPRLSVSMKSSDSTKHLDIDDGSTLVRNCWVKQLKVVVSFDGVAWSEVGGVLLANEDASTVKRIDLNGSKGCCGRFFRIELVQWEVLPVLQLEVYGTDAKEANSVAASVQEQGNQLLSFLESLLKSGLLLLEFARMKWEEIKHSQAEKQEEFSQLMLQIEQLKKQNDSLDKDLKQMGQVNHKLKEKLQKETHHVQEEQTKVQLLTKELEEQHTILTDLRTKAQRNVDQLLEQQHQIQSLLLLESDNKRKMDFLEKSKQDFETLAEDMKTKLHVQEQSDESDQANGTRVATVLADLMALNVQQQELKRLLQSSEQARSELEDARKQVTQQLQEAQSQLLSRAQQLVEEESRVKMSQSKVQELVKQCESHQEIISQFGQKEIVYESTLQAANERITSLVQELESQKQLRPGPEASGPFGASLLIDMQAKEIRFQAEMERLEARSSSLEQQNELNENRLKESAFTIESLKKQVQQLQEQEEEATLQLQVVTEERDTARQKEEQLFLENTEKDQEIERIRDGYVWVTDRMNSKEDELTELQEQLEKYQSLLKLATGSSQVGEPTVHEDSRQLKQLYELIYGRASEEDDRDSQKQLLPRIISWIEHMKELSSSPSALAVADEGAQSTQPAATNGPTKPPSPTTSLIRSPKPTTPPHSSEVEAEIEIEYDEDFDGDKRQ